MSTFAPFTGKHWYRGNLHAHTSLSDGARPPQQLCEIYKNAGYDFLAVTDHDIYDGCPEQASPDFLIIPGGEFAVNNLRAERTACRPEKSWDLVLVCRDPSNPNRLPSGWRFKDSRREGCFDERLAEVIKLGHDTGNLVFLAHPSASLHSESCALAVDGLDAVEVLNYSAYIGAGDGDNAHIWNSLLRDGRHVNGLATDDAHFYGQDACGGWIMVSADELTIPSVMTAVAEGRYYSTTGPEILSFRVENGRAEIGCSPCAAIRLIEFDQRADGAFHSPDGSDSLTHAEFELHQTAKVIRIECVRSDGKTAWTNPYFLDSPRKTAFTELTDPEKEACLPTVGVVVPTEGSESTANRFPMRNGKLRLKGNLHCHTTVSDGEFTPREACEEYRRRGYSFLAITDHNIYTNTREYDAPGFVTLPGVELAVSCGSADNGNSASSRRYTYHINGILADYGESASPYEHGHVFPRPGYDSSWLQNSCRAHVQEMIDDLRAHGNLVTLNHPSWSMSYETDVYGLKNLLSMELYNSVCELEVGCGFSRHYYDFCLRNGMTLLTEAVDDTHAKSTAFGGWVVVSANEASREAITDALRRGCYYSSNGAVIDDYYFDEDGWFNLRCRDARRIALVYVSGGGTVKESRDSGMSGLRVRPPEGELVYAEVQNRNGKFAWTNPLRAPARK